ncbi:MAG: hypothetical protein AB8B97_20335 [Granulosicoccus sp.]
MIRTSVANEAYPDISAESFFETSGSAQDAGMNSLELRMVEAIRYPVCQAHELDDFTLSTANPEGVQSGE